MNGDALTIVEEIFAPVIIPDVPVTLRKRMTFVLKNPGQVIFAGQSLEDALLFLRENNHDSADLMSPTGRWSLDFQSPITEEEKILWLGQQHPS